MTVLRCPPFCLALGAALLALATGAQGQSLLTLVEQARGYDAAWQSAQAQWQASVYRAEQAQAGMRPSAGLAAGMGTAYTEVTRPALEMTTPNRTVTLSAQQPLYRPANRISVKQGERAVALAQAQLDAATQDLLIRVSQAYFDVLAAQDTLTFVQAQKKAVKEQLAAAQRNFEVGTNTITDQREAQARFDLVTAQEITADNDLRVKRLALDQLAGSAGNQPHPLVQPLPGTPEGDVSAWVEKSQDLPPSVHQAVIALDIARLETQKARTGHLPTVDLQAAYAINHYPKGSASIQGMNTRNTSASVGIALNLPLFAGYAVQNRIKETLALEDKAQLDLENLRRTLAQNTRAAYFGVQSGQGQVKALQAAEVSSQVALEANQLGYQVGVRINMDVLNAQSQLYQTKRDLSVARYNLLMGQLRLRQAAGTLTQDDVAAIDVLLAR